MSDPVANVDIEDVLSSIRRLVSNGPDKNGVSSQDAQEAGRLVLTPSQRVDEEADVPLAGDDRMPDNDDTPTGPHATAWAGLTEAHPPGTGLRPEPEPEPEPEPDSGAHALDGDADDDMPQPGAEAQDESAAAFSLNWPEETGDTADDAAPATEVSAGREAAAGDETGAEEQDDAGSADAIGDDPALDGIAAMFARHESAGPTTWEPDGDDEDAFADGGSSSALDWRDIEDAAGDEDHTPEEVSGADHPGTAGLRDTGGPRADHRDAATHETEDNAFAVEDEAVLDEEALRDLVAEIVREELMGTLGERITRNVRKLVRREIHRALNSQDFD